MSDSLPVLASGIDGLVLTADEVYIEFHEKRSVADVAQWLEARGLRLAYEHADEVAPYPSPRRHEFNRAWATGADLPPPSTLLQSLQDDIDVRIASPVYHWLSLSERKTALSFGDIVLASPADGVRRDAVVDALVERGLSVPVLPDEVPVPTVVAGQMPDYDAAGLLALLRSLAIEPRIAALQANWIQLTYPFAAPPPNDQLFDQQWHLDVIDAVAGWDGFTDGDQSVRVAVIDSGCFVQHPDLSAKLTPPSEWFNANGWFEWLLSGNWDQTPDDFDGHGTKSAGVVAAATDNMVGVAGVAPRCPILPIRWSGPMPSNVFIDTFEILLALGWARNHNARVINMSLDLVVPPSFIDAALDRAHDDNIVLVASAGNRSPNFAGDLAIPARHPATIAVGASTRPDCDATDSEAECLAKEQRYNQIAGSASSQFGAALDVVAPGEQIVTTALEIPPAGPVIATYTNGAHDFGRTSAAAPQVSGLAALILSKKNLSPDSVRAAIARGAEKIGGLAYTGPVGPHDPHPHASWHEQVGYGRININASLKESESESELAPTPGAMNRDDSRGERTVDNGSGGPQGSSISALGAKCCPWLVVVALLGIIIGILLALGSASINLHDPFPNGHSPSPVPDTIGGYIWQESGTACDHSGSVPLSVEIDVVGATTGFSQQTQSNNKGFYSIVVPGADTYTLTVADGGPPVTSAICDYDDPDPNNIQSPAKATVYHFEDAINLDVYFAYTQ